MTAADLLDILERRELVSAGTLASLRRQVAQSAKPIAPQVIVKLLVDKQQITPGQAQLLLQPDGAKQPVPTNAGDQAAKPAPTSSSTLSKQSESRAATGSAKTDSTQEKPAGRSAAWAAGQASGQSPAHSPAKRQPASATPSSLEEELGLLADLGLPSELLSAKPSAVAAKKSVSAAAGLDDDLFSDVESTPALFDEGLLSAASSGPAELGGFPADDALTAARLSQPGAVMAAPRAAHPARLRKILIVVGSSLAGVLVISGIVAAIVLRPTGDAEFQAAEKDYQAQAWPAALAKYKELLRDYPGQAHAGTARVHQGMAELRVQLSARPDWQRVLETAERLLPEMAREPEFAELHADLASILADTADALARDADESNDPAEAERRSDQARHALALAADAHYLPPAVRPWQRLQAIDERLALIARDTDRPKALAIAVDKIRQAAARPESRPAAWKAVDTLLDEYPALSENGALRSALVELTASQRALVQVKPAASKPGVRQQRATPIQATTCFVRSRPSATQSALVGTASAGIALAMLDGVVYAFDLGSGKVLWRRYAGLPPAGCCVLLADSGERKSQDALLVDSVNNELVRVDASSGRLKWRQSLPAPLAGPLVVVGEIAYLTDRKGSIHSVNLDSGQVLKSAGQFALPSGGPIVSTDGRYLFQLTMRGELFALALPDLACARVVFVGTGPGTADLAPLAVGRYVIVAENHGLHDGNLRVASLDAQGLPAEVVAHVPIAGRIAAAPVAFDNHVLVADEHGGVTAFELTSKASAPLKKSSESGGSDHPGGACFLVPAGKQFWLTGMGLHRCEIKKGRIIRRDSLFAADTFDQAPTMVGETLISVRHISGERGQITTAVSVNGKAPWQTELGAALPDLVAADAKGGRLSVVWDDGLETQVPLAKTDGLEVVDQAAAKSATPAAGESAASAPFAAGVRLSAGSRVLWYEPADRALFVFDKKAGVPRRIDLPAKRAAAPAAFAGGLVVPTVDGALLLVDPRSGESLATFRPQTVTSQAARWTELSVRPGGGDLLIADDRPMLYQVALRKDPQPQLVKLAAVELTERVTAGPLIAGSVAYVATRDGMLRAYALDGLKPAGEWKLPGKYVDWMRAAGELVLLAAGTDELVGCDARQKTFWKAPLAGRLPCGNPLATKQGVVLAYSNGIVARLAADAGKELAKAVLGEPLIAGPILLGEGFGVVTTDGCLLKAAF